MARRAGNHNKMLRAVQHVALKTTDEMPVPVSSATFIKPEGLSYGYPHTTHVGSHNQAYR
ncbi:MAG: hypothetical protein AAB069_03670 [Planctomycetota bacterium]|jgi:hypothetical protein